MPDEAIQTRIARQLHEFKREFVPKVAALKRPVLGNERVKPEERQRRWWQEAPDWTPEREMQLLAGGMTPEDVGLLRFPNREVDARAAGKGDERKTALYAKEMSELGPPPPDPLAQAPNPLQTVDAGGERV